MRPGRLLQLSSALKQTRVRFPIGSGSDATQLRLHASSGALPQVFGDGRPPKRFIAVGGAYHAAASSVVSAGTSRNAVEKFPVERRSQGQTGARALSPQPRMLVRCVLMIQGFGRSQFLARSGDGSFRERRSDPLEPVIATTRPASGSAWAAGNSPNAILVAKQPESSSLGTSKGFPVQFRQSVNK